MAEFMERAVALAKQAGKDGEVPVGAVVVKDGVIIAESRNTREKYSDPTGHAEVNVIRLAAKRLNNWRLDGCDIYVTLEPCPMCAGLIINSRISRVFFGAYDRSYGSFGSRIDLSAVGYPDRVEVHGGIMEKECTELLSEFFENKRKKA